MATPTLVQHTASTTSPSNKGAGGNLFRFTLPNPVLAGNCLVFGISYQWDAARTIAITDNNGNTWPTSPAVTVTDGANVITAIFVLPNANAGATRTTVTFDGGSKVIAASPTGATEAGTTVTITTTTAHGLLAGQVVSVADVGVAGYNGTFIVATVPTTTTFTYTAAAGLAASGGGTAYVVVQPFQYTVSEFNNVATVTPVNGTSSTAAVSAPGLTSGLFTPGNNDANGGNLIWTYCFDTSNQGSGNKVSSFAAGTGFTLLDADIAWGTDDNMHHAAEYFVQATSAAINPGITATMSPANDVFNVVSVALKAAVAGTAPATTGIRIVRIVHLTKAVFALNESWQLQFPCIGNLILLVATDPGVMNITSVTDSKGNTYTSQSPDTTEPQFWFAGSATPDANLILTLHTSGTPLGTSVTVYDIIGAAPSPFDVAAGVPNFVDTGGLNVVDVPAITPTNIGLTVAAAEFNNGPTSGLDTGSPAGAIFDCVYSPHQTDADVMDNADGRAHLYNSDLSLEHWNWVVANRGITCTVSGLAVHFKAATTAAFEDDSWSRPFILPDDLIVSVYG